MRHKRANLNPEMLSAAPALREVLTAPPVIRQRQQDRVTSLLTITRSAIFERGPFQQEIVDQNRNFILFFAH
jgi:hypothetical protein